MRIETIDMHTGGEPLRVIVGGFPQLVGHSVLDYRRFLHQHHDDLRKALMLEPRGPADMYGCLVTPSEVADFGVVFMHNAGYSTMCGHATIALGKLAVEAGWVVSGDETCHFTIEAPCGILKVAADVKHNQVQEIRFLNVPSFVIALNEKVVVPELGEINYHLAYGGAIYAFVEAQSLDLNLEASQASKIIKYGQDIKAAVIRQSELIKHPFEPDLGFLYGTIFTGPGQDFESHSRNVCVFADGELDRCPTGSGVSARAAIHHAKNELELNEWITIESIVNTKFEVRVTETLTYGPHQAVIPEVKGNAFFTGRHEFWIDPQDPLKSGFLLKH